MVQIFISYSMDNKDYAIQLKRDLENAGYTILGVDDIDIEDSWSEKIEQILQQTNLVIFLIDKRMLQSDLMNFELSRIMEKEGIIIPIIIDNTTVDKLPTYLQYFHIFNFLEDYSTNLSNLLDYLPNILLKSSNEIENDESREWILDSIKWNYLYLILKEMGLDIKISKKNDMRDYILNLDDEHFKEIETRIFICNAITSGFLFSFSYPNKIKLIDSYDSLIKKLPTSIDDGKFFFKRYEFCTDENVLILELVYTQDPVNIRAWNSEEKKIEYRKEIYVKSIYISYFLNDNLILIKADSKRAVDESREWLKKHEFPIIESVYISYDDFRKVSLEDSLMSAKVRSLTSPLESTTYYSLKDNDKVKQDFLMTFDQKEMVSCSFYIYTYLFDPSETFKENRISINFNYKIPRILIYNYITLKQLGLLLNFLFSEIDLSKRIRHF